MLCAGIAGAYFLARTFFVRVHLGTEVVSVHGYASRRCIAFEDISRVDVGEVDSALPAIAPIVELRDGSSVDFTNLARYSFTSGGRRAVREDVAAIQAALDSWRQRHLLPGN